MASRVGGGPRRTWTASPATPGAYARRCALDAARAQVGQDVETYFPRRALGRKQLGRTIELLGTGADT